MASERHRSTRWRTTSPPWRPTPACTRRQEQAGACPRWQLRRFECWSLYVQLAIAVNVAVISFQALGDAWVRMGLQWAAPLLPLAIDGFAVIATLGIIRSQGAGGRFRERASEWIGLLFVLGLSIAGNVEHALHNMDPHFPHILAGAFGAVPPIIVAYGIHVTAVRCPPG